DVKICLPGYVKNSLPYGVKNILPNNVKKWLTFALILVRLPFPVPDPVREAEREKYGTLQEYIQKSVVPDMQMKLRQGFGRAIRTETDTCVVSGLDERAGPGGRYHKAGMEALPYCPLTESMED